MLQRETTWELKSRAIWVREGDRNTKFFHCFANCRRQKNSIWEIYDAYGTKCLSQEDISGVALTFFQSAYDHIPPNCPEDLLWDIMHYPKMFDEEANRGLFKPVSVEEIHDVLLSFHGDKNLGPDGWTVELFTHFFDLF